MPIKSEVKGAIVGYGVIGAVHAGVLAAAERLAAVCEIDEQKNIPYDVPRFSKYEDLLDSGVEAVHICTPHYLHADMIAAALARGIHVFCEKPLCIRAADIGRILAAEKASRAELGVCFQNRTNVSITALRAWLADKEILRAEGTVHWHRDAAYYASAPWRGKWASEGGGVLINQAIHTLDLLQWICGYPTELCAKVENRAHPEIEVEDTATVSCRGGGAPFTLFATTTEEKSQPITLTVETTAGTARIVGNTLAVNGTPVQLDAPNTWLGKPCYGDGHAVLIPSFYECIETGRDFPLDGAEGAKAVRLVLAAYQSKERWIKV